MATIATPMPTADVRYAPAPSSRGWTIYDGITDAVAGMALPTATEAIKQANVLNEESLAAVFFTWRPVENEGL